MPTIGPFELVIILVIILLIFGAGRIRDVASGLGGSIKEFRKAVREDDKPATGANSDKQETKV